MGSGLDREQLVNAQTIVAVGRQAKVPAYGWVVAVATAMQESGLRNLDHGDRDSLGLFQQRAGWGSDSLRMEAATAAGMFYTGGRNAAPGLLQIPGWESMPLTMAAQAVQRSAFPDAYAKWQRVAEQVVADPSVLSAVCSGGEGFVSDGWQGAAVLSPRSGTWARHTAGVAEDRTVLVKALVAARTRSASTARRSFSTPGSKAEGSPSLGSRMPKRRPRGIFHLERPFARVTSSSSTIQAISRGAITTWASTTGTGTWSMRPGPARPSKSSTTSSATPATPHSSHWPHDLGQPPSWQSEPMDEPAHKRHSCESTQRWTPVSSPTRGREPEDTTGTSGQYAPRTCGILHCGPWRSRPSGSKPESCPRTASPEPRAPRNVG